MAGWISAGEFEVMAVSDGILHDSIEIISNLSAELSSALTEPDAGGEIRLPVNCFLVRKEELVCLIDTGAGATLQPSLGRLSDNLAAAGVDPGMVENVLLTHLHPDHVNGLLGPDGAPAFPAAEVHVHEDEAAFWLDQPVTDAFSKAQQHRMLTNRTMLAPYAGRIRRAVDGEVLPGVSIRRFAGHSPGHACWFVGGEESRVLFWGDIVHVAPVQVPHPEASIIYDYDPAMATASRQRLFAEIADTPTIVAGAHLDSFCRLTRSCDGYRLVPLERT